MDETQAALLTKLDDTDLDIEYTADLQLSPFKAEVDDDDLIIECDDQLGRFCRLCLQESLDMLPLTTRIDDVLISDMILAVAGIEMCYRKDMPTKVCNGCMVNLHSAYGIRKQFVEADVILSKMVLNKSVSLVVSLEEFQKNYHGTYLKEADLVEQPLEVLVAEGNLYDDDNTDKGDSVAGSSQLMQNKSNIIEPTAAAGSKKDNDNVRSESKKRKFRRYNLEMNETKLDPNKCYICSEVFDDPESLNVHLPAHVHLIPYSCPLCTGTNGAPQKVVKSLILLHRHFRMHAGSIECPICPFQTCTAVGLYNHMQRYHTSDTDNEYTCEICGSKTLNRRNYMFHLRSHRALEDGRFTCQFCDKKFATKARLVRHERSHTNEKPFQCKYCEKSFNNETSVNTHERTHTGERGYRCDYCGNCYRTNNALREHQRSVHASVSGLKPRNQKSKMFFSEPIKCDVEGCDFVTNVRAKHYSHKSKHEMKFHCEHCSERFATRQRLQQHMFRHTGIKSFCCELCGKSFRFKNSLNEHKDKHSGIRPYTCEVCGMAFVRERSLKEHRMKHTAGMNYECRFCEKKFKYRADQSKHERTHVNKVPKQEVIDYDDSQHTMDLIEVDTVGVDEEEWKDIAE